MSNQDYLHFGDRREACPGLYRMPQVADGGICRIKLDLGSMSLHQMHILAGAARQYGNGQIELTTRGNIQLRGIAANNRQKLIDMLTGCGLGPLVKAGDDIRNIMVNPTAGFDRHGSNLARELAEDLSRRLQTSAAYQALSPKFSFYVDGGEACAVLNHSNDIWLSLDGKGEFFVVGIASCPPVDDSGIAPLGMLAFEDGADAVTALLDILLEAARHDGTIRRMKHLLRAWGRGRIIGALRQKIPGLSPVRAFRRRSWPDRLDLGIHKTRFPDRYYLGIKPQLGRFSPQSLRMLTNAASRILSSGQVRTTPWQGLIFPDCSYDEAHALARACRESGFVADHDTPYARITCCAGLPGCGRALADVQADAHKLAAALPPDVKLPVHLIGCSKSCTATQAMPVTLLAIKPGVYDVYDRDKTKDAKFGRLAAGKVTIDDVTAILTAGLRKSPPQAL